MTCPRCGTENPANNRFCMKCGADMLATAPAEASSAGANAGPATATSFSYTATPGSGAASAPETGTQQEYAGSGGGGFNAGANPNAYSAPPQFAPNPAGYGAGPNMGVMDQSQLAGVGGRLLAYIIDAVVIAVAAIVVGIVGAILSAIHLGVLTALLFLLLYVAAVVYMPYFWVTRAGQTIGMQSMHIKVVKTDGGPITVGTAVLRVIGFIVDNIIFGLPIGLLWCLWDPQKQCWHDKIASTLVVRA